VTDHIAGPLTVAGHGSDALELADAGNAAAKAVTLTATSVTGLAPAAIGYAGLARLDVALGSAADTVTVANTPPRTETTIDGNNGADAFRARATTGPTTLVGGGGTNRFDVGSAAPAAGGTVAGVAGRLTLQGGGGDALPSTTPARPARRPPPIDRTAVVVGSAHVDYSGMATLDLALGSGPAALTVTDTAPAPARPPTPGRATTRSRCSTHRARRRSRPGPGATACSSAARRPPRRSPTTARPAPTGS
jgi:hypothetical protein